MDNVRDPIELNPAEFGLRDEAQNATDRLPSSGVL
jgi:hypothetical protein